MIHIKIFPVFELGIVVHASITSYLWFKASQGKKRETPT
jgi:hypothetical protein